MASGPSRMVVGNSITRLESIQQTLLVVFKRPPAAFLFLYEPLSPRNLELITGCYENLI